MAGESWDFFTNGELDKKKKLPVSCVKIQGKHGFRLPPLPTHMTQYAK